jgi:Raf kinase inhibitor-like YbhB/YbcL family protein
MKRKLQLAAVLFGLWPIIILAAQGDREFQLSGTGSSDNEFNTNNHIYEDAMALTLSSEAFSPGGSIPAVYTCDGLDITPPLEWSDLPAGTKSLALVVDDPDAPDPKAPKRTWVHWVLYNIPPSVQKLQEGETPSGSPPGTRQGLNDWKRTGYGGPCPPTGRHRYVHKLYALDTMLPDLNEPTKAELEAAMEGHVLARGELIGTYERTR